MNGADYVAMKRLTTKAGEVLAEVGETCERVPVESLSWLAEQGLIQPVAQDDPNTVPLADVLNKLAEE